MFENDLQCDDPHLVETFGPIDITVMGKPPEIIMSNDAHKPINKILKERNAQYGDFKTECIIISLIKGSIKGWAGGLGQMKPHHEHAVDMIIMKLVRIVNGDPEYIDNWRDIEGYSKLVADLMEKDNE